MGLFNFSKKRTVGIDIGTASIKVVELSKKGGRFVLENYGIFELNSGTQALNLATSEKQGAQTRLSDEDIIWSIKQLLEQTKISSKDVVASIPSFPTFATTVVMEYLSEEDIANSIQYEARKYIPVPLEDVQLDWSIIKSDAQPIPTQEGSSKPSVEVLLVAVPKADIARYKKIIDGAGLKLKALELESFALSRALIGNDLSPVCIVSIGGRSTSILIIDNGYQRISHDYDVGGFEITRTIGQSLNVSLERAEQLKKNYGTRDVEDNVIREAMSSLLDMMAFEAKKTITNYEELKKRTISKVILVGGLANMPDFANYFAQRLDRSVTLGDPASRMILPTGVDALKSELNTTFAVSIGLAMRNIK